jgi:alpha-glucosidase
VKFLERLRLLTDSYDGRFTLAEVGGEQPLGEMRAFTAGNARLNSAYGFDFLYAEALTPELVAHVMQDWPEGAGWPTWAFENHDAPRALSRWVDDANRDQFARLKMLLLCSLRGSIILYQGEELGLPQVDVPYDRLQDPEAIANWPHTLSRDGARTPMPWSADAPNLGFSTGQPWLPLGPSHRALAVNRQEHDAGSLLAFTRECLALRKLRPSLHHGRIALVEAGPQRLIFDRENGGETRRCTFNLSDARAPFRRSGGLVIATGEVTDDALGAYAALIEEIA